MATFFLKSESYAKRKNFANFFLKLRFLSHSKKNFFKKFSEKKLQKMQFCHNL